LADKYVQEDLQDRCLKILVHSLAEGNIQDIFAFARKQDIALLKNWCLKFIRDGLDIGSLTRFIEYLENQKNSEYEKENHQLIEKTLNFILQDISKIITIQLKTKERLDFLGDFLGKRLTAQNIVKFTWKFPSFENEMTTLRDAMFSFVYTNLKFLEEKRLFQELYWDFGVKFCRYKLTKIEEKEKEEGFPLTQTGQILRETKEESTSGEDSDEKSQRKARKRMDPMSHSVEEEKEEEEETGPILKKTKQSTDGSRN